MNNKNAVAASLAILAMLGFLVMFAVLGFMPVPAANKDFFNMGFIALIGFVGTAFGYYLGSSLGSAQKNELLTRPAEGFSPGDGLSTSGFIRLPVALSLAALSCLIVFAAGCATTGQSPATVHKDTPLQGAGKSLLAVKSTIVTAATATDALCKSGKLSVDKCTQASAVYELSKPAYDAAVNAYLLMSSGGDPGAFDRSMTRIQSIATNLLQISGGAQ